MKNLVPLPLTTSTESFSFPSIKKVLLVDSNPFIAKQLGKIVARLNHLSMGCVSSIESIEECIQIKTPDIIIINIESKGSLDGYQIAKILKLDYEIPFYILYREENLEQKKWAEELNPDGFLLYSSNNSILQNQLQLLLH